MDFLPHKINKRRSKYLPIFTKLATLFLYTIAVDKQPQLVFCFWNQGEQSVKSRRVPGRGERMANTRIRSLSSKSGRTYKTLFVGFVLISIR